MAVTATVSTAAAVCNCQWQLFVVVAAAVLWAVFAHAGQVSEDRTRRATAALKCETVFTSSSSPNGTFTSPGYPRQYRGDVTCRYVFVGRAGERVQLRFTTFELDYANEDAKEPTECENVDVVIIMFYGGTKPFAKYCGSKIPPMLMSTDNRTEVMFFSRPQSAGAGFTAEYSFVSDYGIKAGLRDKTRDCGFIIKSAVASSGVFASPNYPGLYPRNVECHFIFSGKDRERVHITFHKYDIEGLLPRCLESTMSDFVEFSNFNVELTDRKMQRLCGSGAELSVESDGSFFRVTFRANDVYDGTGFNASYHFGPTEEDDGHRSDSRVAAEYSDSGANFPPIMMALLLAVVTATFLQLASL